jgi:dihydrodipicolinate synthase/N-acetylneuraminate lyase
MGAQGIVPSVGNLIPDVCQRLCQAAQGGDWAETERQAERMKAISAIYQSGRTLGQSLARLKAALYCLGICSPDVLPPLIPTSRSEVAKVRTRMTEVGLLS